MENIQYYLTYDLPVPYKNLLIYPIKVKDYLHFSYYSTCLTVNKDEIPDVKVISMSELQYIYHATKESPDKTPYLIMFDRILGLVLKEDESFKNPENSIERYGYKDSKPLFKIGEDFYYGSDYENIRDIICQQNMVELPDKTISKEVRESLEKAREYKDKVSGYKSGTFEDYIVAMSTVTGWSLEYIYDMTVRKFLKSITRYNNLIHYKIYLSASLSGFVEFKDKSTITHWLNDLENKDKYDNVSMGLEAIQDKISMESAKK